MSGDQRCLACGGVRLTQPVQLRASGYTVHVRLRANDGSWLGKHLNAVVQARICVDCGYMLICADEEARAWLKEHAALLTATSSEGR